MPPHSKVLLENDIPDFYPTSKMNFTTLVEFLATCSTDTLEHLSRSLEPRLKQVLPRLEFGQKGVGLSQSDVQSVSINPKTRWVTFQLNRAEHIFLTHWYKPLNLTKLLFPANQESTPLHHLDISTTGLNIKVEKDQWYLTYLVEKDTNLPQLCQRVVTPLSFQCHIDFLLSKPSPSVSTGCVPQWFKWKNTDNTPYFSVKLCTE
ncbi:hypothetical protein K7432_011190 [Basidiobolus ranarum]|uniref:Uncharacterized protein n=1 Tax=Basidiobolus ranarum TaxID=34480 RepID=A0ABR2WMK8_9FUNG